MFSSADFVPGTVLGVVHMVCLLPPWTLPTAKKPDIKLKVRIKVGETQGATGTNFLLFFLSSTVLLAFPSSLHSTDIYEVRTR